MAEVRIEPANYLCDDCDIRQLSALGQFFALNAARVVVRRKIEPEEAPGFLHHEYNFSPQEAYAAIACVLKGCKIETS